jgi:S-DNA-T family DNA segregation ATPase FtsK/SpoIIIE
VSRVQAEIVTAGSAVQVRDLGSTNGTRLDGHAVGTALVEWSPGDLLQIGASTLALRTLDASAAGGGGPAATVPDGAGHLLVNPAPRLLPPPAGGTVTYPEPPSPTTSVRLPWVAVLLPLVVSVPMAWWMRQPTFLAFAVLSPLMMLGQYFLDRRERTGERATLAGEYHAALDDARAELADLLDTERARLLLDHPDPAAIVATAAGPLHRLWERRAGDGDETALRLGLGTRPAATQVRGSPPDDEPPQLHEAPIT